MTEPSDQEMSKPPVTVGWIVYSMANSVPEFIGIYQTEKKAKADVEILNRAGARQFLVAGAMFIGWGQVAPDVFSQNGSPPLQLVKGEPNE